jgi:hypothetical protein
MFYLLGNWIFCTAFCHTSEILMINKTNVAIAHMCVQLSPYCMYFIQHCCICRPSDSTVFGSNPGLSRLWLWQSDVLSLCMQTQGMVMVAPAVNPQSCWEFEGEILVLHHPTTISTRYQVTRLPLMGWGGRGD